MRIDFKDGSHIEVMLSGPGKIGIILGAKDKDNPLKYVTNSCEVSIKEFSELITDLPVELTKAKKPSKEE